MVPGRRGDSPAGHRRLENSVPAGKRRRAAYADIVSGYAALWRDELREAVPRCPGGYLGSRLNVEVDQM